MVAAAAALHFGGAALTDAREQQPTPVSVAVRFGAAVATVAGEQQQQPTVVVTTAAARHFGRGGCDSRR